MCISVIRSCVLVIYGHVYWYFLIYLNLCFGVVVVMSVWLLYVHLSVQSGYITTTVVGTHGEKYSIQDFVIKFVSDLRQAGGFLRVIRFPPHIELTAMI